MYKRYAFVLVAVYRRLDLNKHIDLRGHTWFVESLDKYFGNVCELDIYNLRNATGISC